MNSVASLSIRRAEALYIAVVVVTLIAAQIFLSRTWYLFTHMFVFDEVVTHILVTDPAPSHAAVAVWNGVENNVPGFFLALKAFSFLFNSTSEVAFRAFSFLSILAGLLGIYVSLRRCFPVLAAFATTLAVWTHPLILHHAFNARYYGPLFAVSAWFAYFLSTAPSAPRRLASNLAIGLTAVLLCTTHYFGVLSLALVLFGEVAHRRYWRTSRFVGFAATTVGLLALAACIPLLVSHISKAGATTTWVPPPNPWRVSRFLVDVLFPTHLAAIPLAVWASYLMSSLGWGSETTQLRGAPVTSLAGLSALALTPVALIIFSYAVQPALNDQYAIAAIAGLAPGVALVLSRLSKTALLTLCACFLLIGAQRLRQEAGTDRETDQHRLALIDTIRRNTNSAPVVFETFNIHEIAHYAPDLAGRLYQVDEGNAAKPPAIVNGSTEQEWRTSRAWDVAWTRRYAAVYGHPSVVNLADLRALTTKYLVLGDDPVDHPPPSPENSFYGYQLRHIERNLYEIVNDSKG